MATVAANPDKFKNKTLWLSGTTVVQKTQVFKALIGSGVFNQYHIIENLTGSCLVGDNAKLITLEEGKELSQLKSSITKRETQKMLTQKTLEILTNLCAPHGAKQCVTTDLKEILDITLSFEDWMDSHAHLFV